MMWDVEGAREGAGFVCARQGRGLGAIGHGYSHTEEAFFLMGEILLYRNIFEYLQIETPSEMGSTEQSSECHSRFPAKLVLRYFLLILNPIPVLGHLVLFAQILQTRCIEKMT